MKWAKMWKKIYLSLVFLSLAFILFFIVCSPLAQEKKVKKILRIGIFQFASTAASEKDQKGFEKAFADAGFREKVNVTFDRHDARGDWVNAQAIARRFLFEKFDLIHTIAAPSSQTVAKLIKDTPIVFSSVAHPVDAGLVPKTSHPGTKSGTNVTGVSHRWPIAPQVEMYARLLPKAKRWGTIYHQGDPDSLDLVKEMRESAKRLGLELMEAVISTGEEAVEAASFLAGKIQAFHLIYDEVVLSSLEGIAKICNNQKVPLFTSDLESVPKGALAAYGLNFFSIGYSAGRKAVRILKGEDPGQIPWSRVEALHLVVNEKAARAQGVILSPELLKKSDRVNPQ